MMRSEVWRTDNITSLIRDESRFYVNLDIWTRPRNDL